MSVKKQVFNPYLPLSTYIPDGEPHIFGNRVYVYGSHDAEGGEAFCVLDYECWSAQIDDLTDWRCEGTIYRARQDPGCGEHGMYMYAPDVVQGTDGRFYLYYAMSGGDRFTGPIHAAVCDTPAGRYEYYGAVQTPDGTEFSENITFDPAVINDNGKIWLYYGWSLGIPNEKYRELKALETGEYKNKLLQLQTSMFQKTAEEVLQKPTGVMGGYAVRLGDDMLTVQTEPSLTVPGQFAADGTSFEGHAFFEASSIRKIGDIYYLVYSSQVSHELCYAVSRRPDRDFVFGGVLISNGDIGYQGRKEQDRVAMTGNNHGGMACLNGQWYIFYHRQTHKTMYSRQGCAEPITILPDGSISQVEMTSYGLNGGPLEACGSYPAPIACNITNDRIPETSLGKCEDIFPHITHEGDDRYITEINHNTRIVYKYFVFSGPQTVVLTLRGNARGELRMYADSNMLAEFPVTPMPQWTELRAFFAVDGVHALILEYTGEGTLDFLSFTFA